MSLQDALTEWKPQGMEYEHQDVNALAAEHKCQIIYPEDNELQIDIDTEEAYQLHLELMELYASKFFRVAYYDVTPSKSGLPHRHIVVGLKKVVSAVERIALQAALGSDRKRELISLSRLNQGEQRVTRFFEPIQTLPTSTTNPQNIAQGARP